VGGTQARNSSRSWFTPGEIAMIAWRAAESSAESPKPADADDGDAGHFSGTYMGPCLIVTSCPVPGV
jgi:hypothetical protein